MHKFLMPLETSSGIRRYRVKGSCVNTHPLCVYCAGGLLSGDSEKNPLSLLALFQEPVYWEPKGEGTPINGINISRRHSCPCSRSVGPEVNKDCCDHDRSKICALGCSSRCRIQNPLSRREDIFPFPRNVEAGSRQSD